MNFPSTNEIHKLIKIPRQHIYKSLNDLKDFGLLEHTLNRPKRFQGLPIEQAFSFLIKQRKQQTYKIEKKVKEIINNNHLNSNNKVQENNPNFILLSKKESSIQKRCEEIDNAKKSIDFVTSWKRFPLTIWTFGEKALKALKRNVQIKVILEIPKNIKNLPKEIEKFKKFNNYQIRFITNPPKAIIGVFDKRNAIVKTSAKVGLGEAPSLWTKNPCLVSIISDYFETNWITAMEHVPENIAEIQ